MFSKYLPSCSGFDLIFIDPPYSQGLSSLLLRALDTSSWLRQQTLLIVEERSSETLPQDLITLSLMDQRKYGDTGFWFYQPLPTSPTS
ncbi:MAG: RNA methyltransferase RsmD [Desulfobulbaceae bacterium]|nr:MAG: RNA methyltransferase RsmD [Desulfobulbaceae bacterium]